MVYCSYCGQRATLEIPSIPSQVCLTHAIEFWNALLAFSHVRSTSEEPTQPADGIGHRPIRLAS